ncbi:UNVERIFIED_CONTAM: hypothetical protein Scaly_2265800 [Sesamum calycinum]|uniref:Uncharacterized protein n=1 Tax=Sesamum calycinum TaxID=2727403 RepID=A0AAW2MD34_9LAMI
MKNEAVQVVGGNNNCQNRNVKTEQGPQTQTQHPSAFQVSGPQNVPSTNWRDLISSSWKDENYKRIVMACFIQAVYLLELDRQENRTNQTALAPKWWIPFKYKLVEILIDERDGSIFGAIFEWDRAAALTDFVPVRPSGAPKAVLAFRGTLLRSPTIRRDIVDDLRFLAWESLKGSVRFSSGLKALRSISDKYGSSKICIAGHSLGAGFALQVGRELAKDGIYVDAHLFNPPSVSLYSSLKHMGEKAGDIWKRFRSKLPSTAETTPADSNEGSRMTTPGSKQSVPHLYVNNSDYIYCYYTDAAGADELKAEKEKAKSTNTPRAAAKHYVLPKGKQKILEAHGLEQWWSDDLELQMELDNSKLISRQLKSLYTLPPTEQSPSKGR